ncbi:MAG: FAD-dependent oxidoreductase [Phyllobacteriaceae bacterium]|nr:FAD-dependent oxidoreductase [Phyllobacteriaceae bacterium]
MEKHDVVIIGGGPAGLACATRLRERGISDVVVLERETEAGGVPRHCGHWGFGWESHRKLMTGPAYAARLREDAKGVDIRTKHTVLEFKSATIMRVHAPHTGIVDLEARHVVLATGARESCRAARLIGGTRTAGVMNTGTLQQFVYLKHAKPFERPVIIGGEWVSFSALMTCAHAAIRPAAMIVEEPTITAPSAFKWGARLWYRVKVCEATQIVAIHGIASVEAVEVEHKGKRRMIACDGVIVSGKFVHEDALLKGHLSLAPLRVGNVEGELKTAGNAVVAARVVADQLVEKLK